MILEEGVEIEGYREREKEGERERERNIDMRETSISCLPHAPKTGD